MVRTTAAGSSGGLYQDYSAGVQPGTVLAAADRNMVQEELATLVEEAGFTLDAADRTQVQKAMIALRKPVGETYYNAIKETPVIYSAAKSTANPGNPQYNPIISRAADVDVTSAQAPQLVTKLRASAAEVIGVSSWSATVSGSVVTLPNTSSAIALVKQLQEDALVQRFLSSGQSATYEGSGADFANGRCLNVAGTDYAITAVNVGTRAVTVSGSPATGTQTVIFYPYRIAGSSTSVRLHKLTGFVPVAAGDADGQYIGGLRMMDRGQGHWHAFGYGSSAGGATARLTASATTATITATTATDQIREPITDGTNGAPRQGKTNDPRGASLHCYTHAGYLVA